MEDIIKKKLKILIYEPFVHFCSLGLGFYNGFDDLGHNCLTASTKEINIGNDVDEYFDIIIGSNDYGDNELFNSLKKYKQKFPDTKIVCFTHGRADNNLLKWAEIVSLWCSVSYKNNLEHDFLKNNNLNYIINVHGANSKLFYKKNYDKNFDYSFVGTFGDINSKNFRNQDIFLYPITNKNKNGIIVGGEENTRIDYEQLNEIYNNCKVNLNFHYAWEKGDRVVFNNRTFDIYLSGNIQLIDNESISDFYDCELFIGEKDNWVYMFDELLNNYMAYDKLLKDISDETRQKHLWKNRMQDIIDKLYE